MSWASISAGAIAACALTLFLLALGAGIGLSSVSPWTESSVSVTTFKIGSGIYLVCVAVMASALGGYLAARLRSKWPGLHTNEIFFRDTAHGFLAWAFATLLTATVLGTATGTLVSGVTQGLATGASQAAAATNTPADLAVDRLLRPGEGTSAPVAGVPPGGQDTIRGELSRMLVSAFREGGELSSQDRSYAARVVSARTGLSQAEAEKRVSEIVTETKLTVDKARRAAAQLALWLAASLLLGAFASSLAAVEGGQLRDGTWEGRRLSPRPL